MFFQKFSEVEPGPYLREQDGSNWFQRPKMLLPCISFSILDKVRIEIESPSFKTCFGASSV